MVNKTEISENKFNLREHGVVGVYLYPNRVEVSEKKINDLKEKPLITKSCYWKNWTRS